MEQMHVRAQGLYENSMQASKLADNADGEAMNSTQVINIVLHMFQQFSVYIDQTHADVQSLVNDCEKMSDITEVINQLTEQTNLLALNAAIEAARAGEAGCGFVRLLPMKSVVSQPELGNLQMILCRILSMFRPRQKIWLMPCRREKTR